MYSTIVQLLYWYDVSRKDEGATNYPLKLIVSNNCIRGVKSSWQGLLDLSIQKGIPLFEFSRLKSRWKSHRSHGCPSISATLVL